jgi:hypothetical protein
LRSIYAAPGSEGDLAEEPSAADYIEPYDEEIAVMLGELLRKHLHATTAKPRPADVLAPDCNVITDASQHAALVVDDSNATPIHACRVCRWPDDLSVETLCVEHAES